MKRLQKQRCKLRKPLTQRAKKLLQIIVELIKLKKPVAGRPETYLTYQEVTEALLGQKDFDTNPMIILISNGLRDLEGWIETNRKPELGLIIVNQSNLMPSPFIFKRHNKKFSDFDWWEQEAKRALEHVWREHTKKGQI